MVGANVVTVGSLADFDGSFDITIKIIGVEDGVERVVSHIKSVQRMA